MSDKSTKTNKNLTIECLMELANTNLTFTPKQLSLDTSQETPFTSELPKSEYYQVYE